MIYNDIYNLLQTYIFGSAAVGSNAELVCMLVSTLACLFLIAVPFMVLWRIIKLFMGV